MNRDRIIFEEVEVWTQSSLLFRLTTKVAYRTFRGSRKSSTLELDDGQDRAPRQETDHLASAWSLALTALLILGAPTFGLFTLWMLTTGAPDGLTGGLSWKMWLAGSWFLIAPSLIVVWERGFKSTCSVLFATSRQDGWPMQRISAAVSGMLRFRKYVVLFTSLSIAIGFLLSQEFFIQELGIGSTNLIDGAVGFLMTAWLGATFGLGAWGVLAMLALEKSGLSASRKLRWEPFTTRQIPGMESLSHFAYATGFLFSAGAVFLPVTLVILQDLPQLASVIGFAMVAVLLCGGAASFLVPSLWIERVVRAQRNSRVDSLSERLQGFMNDVQEDRAVPLADLEVLVLLRQTILQSSAAPLAFQVGVRTGSLLVLPIVIALAS